MSCLEWDNQVRKEGWGQIDKRWSTNHNGGVDVVHRTFDDPGVNVLRGGKLEHVLDNFGTSNGGTANGDVVHDKLEG